MEMNRVIEAITTIEDSVSSEHWMVRDVEEFVLNYGNGIQIVISDRNEFYAKLQDKE